MAIIRSILHIIVAWFNTSRGLSRHISIYSFILLLWQKIYHNAQVHFIHEKKGRKSKNAKPEKQQIAQQEAHM